MKPSLSRIKTAYALRSINSRGRNDRIDMFPKGNALSPKDQLAGCSDIT